MDSRGILDCLTRVARFFFVFVPRDGPRCANALIDSGIDQYFYSWKKNFSTFKMDYRIPNSCFLIRTPLVNSDSGGRRIKWLSVITPL